MITALSVILIIDSILELIFVKQNYMKGRFVTKTLLMPLVICIYLTAASTVNYMIITALVFGFIGDVLLLGPDGNTGFFKAGLASFLAGHISYICAFISSGGPLSGIPFYYYLFIIPFILGFLFFNMRLGNKLGNLKTPVMIYAMIILVMSFTSLARGHYIDGPGFWCPFAGSLFFLLSDYLIAHNIFTKKSGGSSALIMSTYILAQVFIVAGFIN